MGTTKISNGRLTFITVILILFAGLVYSRFVQLALASEKDGSNSELVTGERGRIVDRNGTVLAMDIPKYNISIWRPDTKPEVFAAEIPELAAILAVPGEQITEKYQDKTVNYFYAAKRVSADTAQKIRDAQKTGKFKGVQIEEISGRLYPEGSLASYLIGFTGEGNIGRDGVEIKYENELSPKQRKIRESFGLAGVAARKQPRGNTVVLTIDANLQYMIEKIASTAVKENSADAVMAVAMDVTNGEILAYVVQPGYDPNNYWSYNENQRKDLLSLYAYEPGSVFKVFSMASILDMGAITPNTVFNCDGAYRKTLANGQKIVIKDLHVYGMQNLAGILAHSSNAGVGYASDLVSDIDLYQRLASFGFGMKTGVGLSGESSCRLKEPEKWSARTKPTLAIGQEVLVTALQMITAASAVANGGVLLQPTTVKKIETADGEVVYEHEVQEVRRVISEKTAHEIITAMESAATMEGTGWRAKVQDVRMAVKTGTAQMTDPQTGAYSDKDYIASTLGIFPADNPKIALYIAIIKPKGPSYLGGQIVAPVLRQAAEAVLTSMDLPRDKSPLIRHDGTVVIAPLPRITLDSTVPDMTGMPKRALLELVSDKSVSIVIQGDGYVVGQDPAPGTLVSPGMKLVFTLQ